MFIRAIHDGVCVFLYKADLAKIPAMIVTPHEGV